MNILTDLKKQINEAKIKNNGIDYNDYYVLIGHDDYHNSIKYNLCPPCVDKKEFDYELERKILNLYGIRTMVCENFTGVELVLKQV